MGINLMYMKKEIKEELEKLYKTILSQQMSTYYELNEITIKNLWELYDYGY